MSRTSKATAAARVASIARAGMAPGAGVIGSRLRKARVNRGMSASELAEKAGLSHETIRQVESGRDPKVSTIERLADALGIAPAWLTNWE